MIFIAFSLGQLAYGQLDIAAGFSVRRCNSSFSVSSVV